MDDSPFARLSGELRNKIYELIFRYGTQEITLNLTPWQVPKIERPEQPDQNVSQQHYAITQTCRAIRSETLKLFYHTNAVTLAMADFEDHTSPFMAPPRKAIDKLLVWREKVGREAAKEIRQVKLSLQYHYLGSHSRLELDPKTAAVIRDVFHPDAITELSILLHLPGCEQLFDVQGQRLRGMGVTWKFGNSRQEWTLQVGRAENDFIGKYQARLGTPPQDILARLLAIAQAAKDFFLSGIPSIHSMNVPLAKPVYGPPLPPDMEAARDEAARISRQQAWNRQNEANRLAVMGQ